MSRRTLSQQSFFALEYVMPDCLQEGTVPWLLARHRSLLMPQWLFCGWRGEGHLGRNAWPVEVLMSLVLLRWTEEGISRLGPTTRVQTAVWAMDSTPM